MRLLLPVVFLFACTPSPSVVPVDSFSCVWRITRVSGPGWGTAVPVLSLPTKTVFLTAKHVANKDSAFNLILGKRKLLGTKIWEHPTNDIALVTAATTAPVRCLSINDSPVQPYTRGYVAGYPLRAKLHVSQILFQGDTSLDALAGPGISGGPVLDESGEIRGLLVRGYQPRTRLGDYAGFSWLSEMAPLEGVRQQLQLVALQLAGTRPSTASRPAAAPGPSSRPATPRSPEKTGR